ncbi:hypothetical protein DV736_g948, partial [Chaetothyriales sp. CBS 134916]
MQQNADAARQDEKKAIITVEVPTQWTALNGGELPYLDATWHDTNPPTELFSLPSNAILPPKLVEILNWSLQRHNFNAPSAAENMKQQSGLISGALSTPLHSNEDKTRSSFTGGTQPISLERKLFGIKSVKADVKVAIDRVKTLMQKHDLERAISTRQMQDAKHKTRSVLAECISCFDEFPTSDLVKVQCKHNYCKHCLSVLVVTALQNESAFPPKCCLTEIEPHTIIIPLDSKQREIYKEKVAEYSIPANRRWYCPNTACTKWIPPNKLQADRMKPQKCPKADLANREAALRRSRAERSAAEEREIQEVARANAEIEQIAREDEERRLQQEAQRVLELQLEEAELARLEQIRLQEEQQRQRDEEEAERQLHEALRLSVEEEAEAILQALKDVIYHQHLSLDDRQRHQEQLLHDQFEKQKGSQAVGAKQLQTNIDHNIVKRKERLKAKQDSELQALARKHQFQEDDIFLQIQLYLQGKPNREIREKRMFEELAKCQEDACQSLKVKHQTELEKFEKTADMEIEGIMRSHRSRERLDEEQHRRKLKKLRHAWATERIWFVKVQTRRKEMVHEHSKLVLQAFNAGQDTVGLTEELAGQILPLPLQEFQEDGTSSLQHTPVELKAPPSMNLIPTQKSPKNINQVLEHLKQTLQSPTDSFITANEDHLDAYEHPATKSASKQTSLGALSLTAATPAVNCSESPPNSLIPEPTTSSSLPKSKSLSPLATHTLQATTTSMQKLKIDLPQLDTPSRSWNSTIGYINKTFHPIPLTASSASPVPAPLSVANTQHVPLLPQRPPPPRPHSPSAIASYQMVPRRLPSLNLGNPIFIDGLTAEYSHHQQ